MCHEYDNLRLLFYIFHLCYFIYNLCLYIILYIPIHYIILYITKLFILDKKKCQLQEGAYTTRVITLKTFTDK